MKIKFIFPLLMAAVISIGMTYLYFQSSTPETELHYQIINQIQTVKHANTQLNEAVFESSSRQVKDYDSLSDKQHLLAQKTLILVGIGGKLEPLVGTTFGDIIRHIGKAEQKKSKLIEYFKRDNALLNNSLHYYPTLMEEVKSLSLKNSLYDPYHDLAEKVIYYTLNYHPDVFDVAKSTVKKLREKLSKSKKVENDKYHYLINFLGHSEVILDSVHKRLGMASIKAHTSTNNLLDKLNEMYMAYYSLQVREADRFRKIMFVSSLLLISIVLYVLLLLIRSAMELTKEREKALSASHSKSAFLANMSHEIRTPLTAIIGFGESTLDSSQTIEERLAATRAIVRNGNHLLHVINEILDISKIESGKMDVEIISTDIFDILNELEITMQLHASEKGLLFKISPKFPLPEKINTDPVRLRQILFNLTNNAIKFTENGRVEVQVSCDCEAQKIKFIVTDTGVGLSEEQIEKLFSPFVQADSSTTRKYGGTGLGLHISKLLVEALGGSLTVTSTPRQGSQFSFTIDPGQVDEKNFLHEAVAKPMLSDHSDTNTQAPSLCGSILLAEDNPDNQDLISFFIRKTGASLKIVDNGLQALNEATEKQYDLILMDMQMPELDGLEAIRRLRAVGYDKPIFTLTANATKEDIDNCHTAGANGFLSKPVDWKKFYQVLSDNLEVTAKASSNSQAIDSKILEEEPQLKQLVIKFLNALPERMENLETAYAADDWQTMSRILHQLKGLGGNFGYPQMTTLSARMEFEIKKQDTVEFAASFKELQDLTNQMLAGKPDAGEE